MYSQPSPIPTSAAGTGFCWIRSIMLDPVSMAVSPALLARWPAVLAAPLAICPAELATSLAICPAWLNMPPSDSSFRFPVACPELLQAAVCPPRAVIASRSACDAYPVRIGYAWGVAATRVGGCPVGSRG